MSKKIVLLIAAVAACIILGVSYTVNYYNTGPNIEGSQPQDNTPETPEDSQLVIPESLVGTLGLISALAAGFGMFTIMKKRR